ncbi:MAG: GAF domain-containing sensor histidine kinase [Anaerolineae bacterium]|jgi:signal transduction histidine kinase
MSTEQQRQLHQALHERAHAIADAWYRAIRASSSASLTAAEIRQVVDDLALQIPSLLLDEGCDQGTIDALATGAVSLRLRPTAFGALQEILVEQLVEGLPAAQVAALATHPRRLTALLTASLLRGREALLLEEQEQIRHAYLDTIEQAQQQIRLQDTLLQEQVKRLRALQRIDRGILAANSTREICQAALRHLHQAVPCQRASVTLFDLESDRALILGAVPPDSFDLGEGQPSFPLAGWEQVLDALQQDEIHVIDDLLRLPLPAPMKEQMRTRPPHTFAVVPMYSEGELLGSLNLALERREDLTSLHTSAAQEVADSLAIAIHHAQLDASIAHHREQLRLLTGRLAELDEAKRRALARELHDRIGQRLTALGINLNLVKSGLDGERAPWLCSRLDDSLTLLEETTDCVRQVMAELRPPMLDDYGLVPTLHWCGEQLASLVEIDVAVEGREPDPRLPASMEDALVRITQEALTNVARHAKASRVRIALSHDGDSTQLSISDNGAGFDLDRINRSETPYWGLLTMAERAEAVGGRCCVESQPGEGTRVVVEVPR